MDRQRQFIKGVVTKLQTPGIIPKLPEIIEVSSKYIQTDMNILQLSKYAALAKQIKLDQCQIATLPGHPSHSLSISYWILEPDKVQEVIDKLIFREEFPNPKEETTVSILYNQSKSGEISTLKEKLAEKKFVVSCTRPTERLSSEIIEHSKFVSTGMINSVKKIVPGLENARNTFIPEDNYLCGESDMTIILSN